ncbi:MAG: hypothetical protein C3F06_00590 [Candidatus Methanoperedenaceae archaeon]|nr:MAG: hypothetical protein C3F06_00590 [Candidatus Methanoperedenaceae archaeon]
MTDSEKISELLLDTAWKSFEFIQARVDKMEDKANNIMAFSGVLMTIDIALIVESNDSVFISILLFIEMVLLIKSVWYGYCTIKLQKQNLLDMVGALRTINLTDHIRSAGDLAITISNKQQELLDLMKIKSLNLKNSMKWFTSSLGFLIFISFIYLLSALLPMIQSAFQQLCLNP